MSQYTQRNDSNGVIIKYFHSNAWEHLALGLCMQGATKVHREQVPPHKELHGAWAENPCCIKDEKRISGESLL